MTTEIRRKHGRGVMIFEGMQDHTADSIKSLEGFGRAWVEEAHSISQRSFDILLPTIRADGFGDLVQLESRAADGSGRCVLRHQPGPVRARDVRGQSVLSRGDAPRGGAHEGRGRRRV
jgi:hypothetical protein